MSRVFDFPGANLLFDAPRSKLSSSTFVSRISYLSPRSRILFWKKKFWCGVLVPLSVSCALVDGADHSAERVKPQDAASDEGEYPIFPTVQTLRSFPEDELLGKTVLVRFDSTILLTTYEHQLPPESACLTIKYLHEAGSRVVLASSWDENTVFNSHVDKRSSTESVAELLSTLLKLEVVPLRFSSGCMKPDIKSSKAYPIFLLENLMNFKGEVSNCSKFAKELASAVDIVVNDAFSQSHKMLASTVGIAGFCYACIAGFHFEESLDKLKKIINAVKRPFMAIIGGGNLTDKASAVRFLASKCDGLAFVGSMAFQIMYALGIPVPMRYVEFGALKEANAIVEFTKSRNIPIVLPIDVWCMDIHDTEQMEIFSAHSIPEGWSPIDIGPQSLQKMTRLLSEFEKIMWIGPMKFSSSNPDKGGTLKLAEDLATRNNCEISFVGKMESKLKSHPHYSFKNAAVVWEVLKGRKLPGLMALDRAYPFEVDWSFTYDDPKRPLVVDIGSGNGLFLFGMATRKRDMNFLGLEINSKLVDRCLGDIQRLGLGNVHFISTNATSTFRSILSNYIGELVLVSIQCPNPDFNKPENRWRMLRRSLVEAITNKLTPSGKVFLQSDVEAVAVSMKNEFIRHGKGNLTPSKELETDVFGFLKENPFGVPSDWERHALDRGNPMYRYLLSKDRNTEARVIID